MNTNKMCVSEHSLPMNTRGWAQERDVYPDTALLRNLVLHRQQSSQSAANPQGRSSAQFLGSQFRNSINKGK